MWTCKHVANYGVPTFLTSSNAWHAKDTYVLQQIGGHHLWGPPWCAVAIQHVCNMILHFCNMISTMLPHEFTFLPHAVDTFATWFRHVCHTMSTRLPHEFNIFATCFYTRVKWFNMVATLFLHFCRMISTFVPHACTFLPHDVNTSAT